MLPKLLGLPLGLEAPVMTPKGVIFLFFFYPSLMSWQNSSSKVMPAVISKLVHEC